MRAVVNVHTIDAVVRVCVMVMPLACWPVMVIRRPGVTIVHFEARATRRENTEGIIAACTEGEAEVIRRAYKMPPGVTEEWALAEEPALLWVPPDLRMPGWPALQGGEELVRRRMAGETMAMELACMKAETIVLPRPRRSLVDVRERARMLRGKSQALRQQAGGGMTDGA